MREETTTLLRPCASRKETGFCSDCPREIYYFLEITHQPLWLVSLLNTSYFKKGGDYYVISGGIVMVSGSAELETLLKTNRNVQISAHVSMLQCVVWLWDGKDSREMSRVIREIFVKQLWCCFIKPSWSTAWSPTHLMSTHIHLTFQLPLHANPSISD